MGISTSRLCDRRAYRGRIDGEYRMRAPSVASRSRTRGWRTATGPMPVMISRSGRWPWRTTRCWPAPRSILRDRARRLARNSARPRPSTASAQQRFTRAAAQDLGEGDRCACPLVGASLMTLLSGQRRITPSLEKWMRGTPPRYAALPRSRRHQLLAIARTAFGIAFLGAPDPENFWQPTSTMSTLPVRG
mgnify:CR=1 FL=1